MWRLPTLTAPSHRGQARAGADRMRWEALEITACSGTARQRWKGVGRKAISEARATRFRDLAARQAAPIAMYGDILDVPRSLRNRAGMAARASDILRGGSLRTLHAHDVGTRSCASVM